MLQMLENPAVQQTLQATMNDPNFTQQLPSILEMAAQTNPAMQEMMRNNPQAMEMFRNPEFLRSMANPETMRAMLQIQQAMQTLQNTGADAPVPGATGPGTQPSQPAQTTPPTAQGQPGAAPTPNPFGNLFGGMHAPAPAPAATLTQEQLEELYQSQLVQLRDMGFLDTQMCIQALRQTGGNVSLAVERLLNQFGG
eukprot:Plantae.Rhodophyta-Rhodochaete_pulchella.ctg21665.p1 GENE.Plantae.Rhodophyta-Rhodochaete_pulchella.ctg21665~~Plantae.Rhodophyta-Rhodochaete_pulchella.ctg21665.p1  ORF type:complete len:220 (+),score=23.59 Plantae.Rhodophyta-Rhodochaete_pulchella.ctg21665:75-662(+)